MQVAFIYKLFIKTVWNVRSLCGNAIVWCCIYITITWSQSHNILFVHYREILV